MTEFGDSGAFQLAMMLVIALTVGYVGITAIDTGEIQQQQAEASAYCHQVYDDPSVYTAAVQGGHGGTHCVANNHGPHLHEIPEEYIHEAYEANQSGETLGWDVATASEQAKGKPDEIPLLGVTWGEFKKMLPVTLGVPLVIVCGAYWYGRRYGDSE